MAGADACGWLERVGEAEMARERSEQGSSAGAGLRDAVSLKSLSAHLGPVASVQDLKDYREQMPPEALEWMWRGGETLLGWHCFVVGPNISPFEDEGILICQFWGVLS